MHVLIFQSAHQTGSGSTDSGGTHETTGKHTTRFPTVRHFSYPSSCRRGDSSRTSIILFACRPRVILQFILIQTQDHLHSTFSQSPSMHTSRLAQCPHECMFYESVLSPPGPDLMAKQISIKMSHLYFWCLYDFKLTHAVLSKAIQLSRFNRVSPCLSRSAMPNSPSPLTHLIVITRLHTIFITLGSQYSSCMHVIHFQLLQFDSSINSGFHDSCRFDSSLLQLKTDLTISRHINPETICTFI